ncbi:MAG TPA: pantoate--beta-alanine ligase [Gemmatimonadaceae bacterium]|nr:pantoate--beta-alanine ligase [Gemmatimonadaceae bacterium]
MPRTATRLRRVSAVPELRAAISEARRDGARIGFVPTMGALHAGHLSLVERARDVTQVVVMSIFVNPLQFGPNEDFSRYPRPIEDDERLAEEAGADLLFTPTVADMYPEGRTVSVSAGEIATQWEGAVRPGHFDGVLTVVAKLFNLVQPDVAVFGRKDLQQAALVKALVRDLDFPLEILVAPIIREPDGLALSSRNRYLNESDRADALVLSRALNAVAAAFDSGEIHTARLEEIGNSVMNSVKAAATNYFAVVNRDTFQREEIAQKGSAVIVAAKLGTTRLIDNIILGENDSN